MAKKGELTEKQKVFCREYIWDFNAARAARVAGYSEDSIYNIASENLTKPEIQAYIKELQGNTAELAGISRLMIAEEFKKMAFSSIAHLHETWIDRKEFEKLTPEQKACIAEIQTQIRKTSVVREGEPEMDIETEFFKIKLYDKQKSLDSLIKMFGYSEPEKVHVSGVRSYEIVPASGKAARGK